MSFAIGCVTIAVIIMGFAYSGVQLVFVDDKVCAMDAAVQALPDKINGNLLSLTRTLADAINAAKQAPPDDKAGVPSNTEQDDHR